MYTYFNGGMEHEQQISKKQETSEKLKAKQYGAAALSLILVAIIMTVIRLIWGSVMLGIAYFLIGKEANGLRLKFH